MPENKKPDYTDLNWDALIKDRTAKWAKMNADLAAEGLTKTEIWDGEIPGFVESYGQPRPTLTILPIHKEKRGIFIVCAGGGFMFKSSNEAKPVAEYFHAKGINTAILDYRVRPYDTDAPCADGLRAIRYLRYNADKLGILGDKIAIGGFSAGGMLTGMAATRFDYGDPTAADPVERVSSRPDAALLLYGAMSHSTGTGMGLGYDIEQQNAAAKNDNIKNLRHDCPPFFIFQTHRDDPRSAMTFGKELGDRGIPFEVHTFHDGPHGGGLYDGNDPDSPYFPHTMRWAELAAEWLCDYGF